MNTPYHIQDKTILVTGANRGIGKSIVETLIARGAKKVYATARNPESTADLVASLGDKVVPLPLDLSQAETITAAAQAASDVEVVINNGGILKTASPLDPHAIDTFSQEIDVNVYGLIRVAQAFAPILKNNGGGALVQLNSVASLKSFADFATYSASKAASYSITQGLKDKLKEQGTIVLSVHPGPIATDMAHDAGITEIAEPPSLVAEGIVNALANGQFHLFPDSMAQQFQAAYQSFADSIIAADFSEAPA